MEQSTQIVWTETRGRPKKYSFDGFEVGEMRVYEDSNIATLLQCANAYSKRKRGDQKFSGRTQDDGSVVIKRIK